MSLDHAGAVRSEVRWLWASLALWLLLFQGRAFVENFHADDWQARATLPDFFQEWSSARSHRDGLPVYTNLGIPVERYVKGQADIHRSLVIINAHPPTSVLLAYPFAYLEFDDAFLAWNLAMLGPLAASLALVAFQLRVGVRAWWIFPLVALGLLCSPLWQQIHQGQLNLILLLLITGAWAAERSGRPLLAGTLLGTAIAIKIFPALLLLYYVMRRRWAIVTAGLATLGLLTAVTAATLGAGAYRDYVRIVLPEIQWFRVGWNNNSLYGYWSRLFDPAPERVREFSRSHPLIYSPFAARALYRTSAGAILALLGYAARRARTRLEEDRAFAAATAAMLLVSPIAWEHYLLLLLVPIAILVTDPNGSRAGRVAILVVSSLFFLSPVLVWTVFDLGATTARPLDNLTTISYQFYSLLAFFGLGIHALLRGTPALGRGPSLV